MTAEKDLGARISEMIASRGEELDEEERREAPRRERIERLRASTPRVIYRDDGRGWWGAGRASYHALRLSDARWTPARTETYSTFGSSKQRTRRREAHVTISRGGGSQYAVSPDRLGEFLRRPTSKALRRLEEAEEALRRARAEVVAAERAAFTYGKPVTVAAVKEVTRAHARAWNGEE